MEEIDKIGEKEMLGAELLTCFNYYKALDEINNKHKEFIDLGNKIQLNITKIDDENVKVKKSLRTFDQYSIDGLIRKMLEDKDSEFEPIYKVEEGKKKRLERKTTINKKFFDFIWLLFSIGLPIVSLIILFIYVVGSLPYIFFLLVPAIIWWKISSFLMYTIKNLVEKHREKKYYKFSINDKLSKNPKLKFFFDRKMIEYNNKENKIVENDTRSKEKIINNFEIQKQSTLKAYGVTKNKIHQYNVLENNYLDEKEKISKELIIIPPFYFEKDAISKMMFLFTNKRADNIKDLINLYEQTEWQEKLLNAVKNVSNNVNQLTNLMYQGLVVITKQLGIINDNIQYTGNNIANSLKAINYSMEQSNKMLDEKTNRYLELVETAVTFQEDAEKVKSDSAVVTIDGVTHSVSTYKPY